MFLRQTSFPPLGNTRSGATAELSVSARLSSSVHDNTFRYHCAHNRVPPLGNTRSGATPELRVLFQNPPDPSRTLQNHPEPSRTIQNHPKPSRAGTWFSHTMFQPSIWCCRKSLAADRVHGPLKFRKDVLGSITGGQEGWESSCWRNGPSGKFSNSKT